jgi:hypothetical protein
MDIATFVTSLLGLIGVVIAIFTIKSNSDLHRRQMNAEVFMKYAERYEQIMSCFPEDAFRARFSMSEDLPPPSAQLTLAVLRYLNMSSEEFYLWKKKYVADEVWKIWEDELIRILQSPLLRREWQELESEFQSYPEFLEFVKAAQRAQPALAPGGHAGPPAK